MDKKMTKRSRKDDRVKLYKVQKWTGCNKRVMLNENKKDSICYEGLIDMTVSKASLPVLEGRAAEKFLEDMKRAKLDPKIFKGAKQKLKEICDELGL